MSGAASLFLVIGATGTQGSATTRALLKAGHPVRILTRNPDGAVARELAGLGAEVFQGDLDQPGTLAPAMKGVTGVFAVPRPDVNGSDSERLQGFAVIKAALDAGVKHFVQSSVCQAGEHDSFPGWSEGYWAQRYWLDKWEVEEAVRAAGFPYWSILRPTFIMENFKGARAQFLYPQLSGGKILTPVNPDAELQLIAGADIGAAACAVLEDPERFGGKTIDLVSETLTMAETAAVLGEALGKTVKLETVSPEAAISAGINDRWVRSQEWINVVGYRADASHLPDAGVKLTPFANWVKQHAGEIVVGG